MRVQTVFWGLIGVLSLALLAGSEENPDRLLGVWLTQGKDEIRIYKERDRYFGKPVVKPGNETRLDLNNPDEALRSRPLLHVEILKDFEYRGENRWGGGTIYDPDNGKTYRCQITLKNANTIKVRGYVGVSLLGRTEYWRRVSEEG